MYHFVGLQVFDRVFRREPYSIRYGNIVYIRVKNLKQNVTPSGNRTQASA